MSFKRRPNDPNKRSTQPRKNWVPNPRRRGSGRSGAVREPTASPPSEHASEIGRAMCLRYCALGAFGSDEGADAPQNARVARRLSDHARPTRGVVPGRVRPVFGTAGAHGVLGNALKKRTTQTKIEKQRPQAPKNGFRFAVAPLLGRSGRCKNVPRVRRASPSRLRRSRNGQRTFNTPFA
eukprot:COSAG06_NODE_725_length_12789_cov_11.738534_9_plen_180_part_00